MLNKCAIASVSSSNFFLLKSDFIAFVSFVVEVINFDSVQTERERDDAKDSQHLTINPLPVMTITGKITV